MMAVIRWAGKMAAGAVPAALVGRLGLPALGVLAFVAVLVAGVGCWVVSSDARTDRVSQVLLAWRGNPDCLPAAPTLATVPRPRRWAWPRRPLLGPGRAASGSMLRLSQKPSPAVIIILRGSDSPIDGLQLGGDLSVAEPIPVPGHNLPLLGRQNCEVFRTWSVRRAHDGPACKSTAIRHADTRSNQTHHRRASPPLAATGDTSAEALAVSHPAPRSSPAAFRNTRHAMTRAWPTSAAVTVVAIVTVRKLRPLRVSPAICGPLTIALACMASRRSKSASASPQARRPPIRGTDRRTWYRGVALSPLTKPPPRTTLAAQMP
jgi:hypothetical protein